MTSEILLAPGQNPEIKVSVKISLAQSGDLHVSVECGLTSVGEPALVLRSSDVLAPVMDEAVWDAGVVRCLNARLASGEKKGRVLAIWERSEEDSVVAVLSWHYQGSGALVVFDVAVAGGIDDERASQLHAILLAALLEAARHPSSPVADEWAGELWWSQAQAIRLEPPQERPAWRRTNRGRAFDAGFENFSPPPKQPPGHLKHKGSGWVGKYSP